MYQTLEERVANIEGRIEEHTRAWEDIKDMLINHDSKMIAFEQRIDRRFEAIDKRFELIDRRFEAMDRRFEAIDRRFEAMDRRFEAMDRKFDNIENRISSLDQKFSRYFLWIIGFQFSTLLSIIAVILK